MVHAMLAVCAKNAEGTWTRADAQAWWVLHLPELTPGELLRPSGVPTPFVRTPGLAPTFAPHPKRPEETELSWL